MAEQKDKVKAAPVELTVPGILVAILLTLVLAMSNAYLALKVGILTSASIPAAVLAMSFLKLFRRNNILENNLIQTAASAGEAIAGGIVYTIPALIIIRYWEHFSYFENVLIALIGGGLGVMFSIPLRRILVHQPRLPFPEGKAVAEVLKASQAGSIYELVAGGLTGALLELMQTGFKVVANSYQVWFSLRRMIFGFGVGFSATLIGAGYLIGFEIALSIFIGALIGWVVAVPLTSLYYPQLIVEHAVTDSVMHIWNAKIRYIGIGAMLAAGTLTFCKMLKPLLMSIRESIMSFKNRQFKNVSLSHTEQDIPLPIILILVSLFSGVLFVFFQSIFPLSQLHLPQNFEPTFIFFSVIYVLVVGFIFAVITGYFSGLVGVSASPGSSIIIAGMLLAAWILVTAMSFISTNLSSHQVRALEAITIIIGAVITGIAAISNDNIQDLKVGQLIGATPWKQQVMLFLGVIVSSLVIPPIMQLLFDVYGIAGVMPHPKMDISQSLPAPPAALMAAVTQAVFNHGLPWLMLMLGAMIIILVLPISAILRKHYQLHLSTLGIAIGIYLPMTSSIPLFVGGILSLIIKRHIEIKKSAQEEKVRRNHAGLLIACGLVAGASLMDVVLAVPFSMARSPDVLKLNALIWHQSSAIFALLTTVGLCVWVYQLVCKR